MNNMQDPFTVQCNTFKKTRMLNRTSFDPDECKFQCKLCGLNVKYNNMKSHEKCARHKVSLRDWEMKKCSEDLDLLLQIV